VRSPCSQDLVRRTRRRNSSAADVTTGLLEGHDSGRTGNPTAPPDPDVRGEEGRHKPARPVYGLGSSDTSSGCDLQLEQAKQRLLCSFSAESSETSEGRGEPHIG